MPTRLLKVRATLPFHLENRLVNHWGYAIEKRSFSPGTTSYILLKKPYISDKKTKNDDGVKRTIRASVNDNIIPFSHLPEWQRKQIERRCDNIVNFFPDPYSVPHAVRARLIIMQQRLLPAEAEFVQEFMDENFPVS